MHVESKRTGLRTANHSRQAPSRRADSGSSRTLLLPKGSVLSLIAVAGAGGIAVLAAAAFQWQGEDLALLGALAALALAAERFDIGLFGDGRVSVSVVGVLAAGTLAGLPGIAVVASAVALATYIGRNRPLYKAIYNQGVLLLAGAAYVGVFEGIGSAAEITEWPALLLPALAGTIVNFAVNSGLVAEIIALDTKRGPLSVWNEKFRWLLPHYLVLGAAAVALATAHDELGLWGIAVFAIPVLTVRYALQQYAQRSAQGVCELTHAADRVKALEMDTEVRRLALQGVASALDRHNGDGAKHRQRVVELCRMVADAVGIRTNSREWLALEQAALLHDLGTISLPADLFQKPGPLTTDEWALIRQHPAQAYEVLTETDGLADVAEILLAHHERFDGSGYPRGLAGEEIPLGARILAIAEALEAMTAGRPYRSPLLVEEALLELEHNRGRQFDPWVVDNFLASIKPAHPLQRV